MATYAKRIIECLSNIKELTGTFYLCNPLETIETREQFACLYTKVQKYLHELYILSFRVETSQKHIHDFYNSDGYFAKKEIRAFSGAISNICKTLHSMQSSSLLSSYDSFSSDVHKNQEYTLSMRLATDMIRLNFIVRNVHELFEPLLEEYDKIIKIIKDSMKIMDVESTLYI